MKFLAPTAFFSPEAPACTKAGEGGVRPIYTLALDGRGRG